MPTSSRRRSRAQGYVEFGLGLAVIALIAVVGLDQLRGKIYTYFTGTPTQNVNGSPPPPPPPPSPDATLMGITCPAGPINLGPPGVDCTVTLINQDHPAVPPTGTIQADTDAGGGVDGNGTVQASCLLVNGSCMLNYQATHSGLPASPTWDLHRHTVTVSYSPTGLFKPTPNKTAQIQVKRNAEVTLNKAFNSSGDPPECGTQYLVIGFMTTTTCTGYAKEYGETVAGPVWPRGKLTWQIVGGTVTGGTVPGDPTSCKLLEYLADPSASYCSIQITSTVLGLHNIGQVTYVPDPAAVYPDLAATHSGPFSLHYGVSGTQPLHVVEATTTEITGCDSLTVPRNGTVDCSVKVTNHSTTRAPAGKVVWIAAGGQFQDVAVPGAAGAGVCVLLATGTPGERTCTVHYTAPNVVGTYPLLASFAEQNDFMASASPNPPSIAIDVT